MKMRLMHYAVIGLLVAGTGVALAAEEKPSVNQWMNAPHPRAAGIAIETIPLRELAIADERPMAHWPLADTLSVLKDSRRRSPTSDRQGEAAVLLGFQLNF